MHRPFKIGLIFLVSLAVLALPSAFVQADSYQELLTQQENLSKQINDNRSTIVSLQKNIDSLTQKIKTSQNNAANQARSVQTSNLGNSIMNQLLSSTSLSTAIQRIISINMIVSATNRQTNELKNEKNQKSKALSALTKAQDALNNQENTLAASIEASNAAALTDATATVPDFTPQSLSADSDVSEAAARANIVARESTGNYAAQNGRYYGAYQLDISYLNGDTSPANQDAVAEAYVTSRYGSWANAWAFWQVHGWY